MIFMQTRPVRFQLAFEMLQPLTNRAAGLSSGNVPCRVAEDEILVLPNF